jgi:hypothetical protein
LPAAARPALRTAAAKPQKRLGAVPADTGGSGDWEEF